MVGPTGGGDDGPGTPEAKKLRANNSTWRSSGCCGQNERSLGEKHPGQGKKQDRHGNVRMRCPPVDTAPQRLHNRIVRGWGGSTSRQILGKEPNLSTVGVAPDGVGKQVAVVGKKKKKLGAPGGGGEKNSWDEFGRGLSERGARGGWSQCWRAAGVRGRRKGKSKRKQSRGCRPQCEKVKCRYDKGSQNLVWKREPTCQKVVSWG